MQKEERCWRIHELLADQIPFKEPSQELLLNGIYFFYEDGEYCEKDGIKLERIVRVGTHIKQDNFQKRIHYHYNGNKNGSVFRKHLGSAIIARDDQNDPRLSSWLAKGTKFPEIEGRVNELLRENFCFRWVRVDGPNERLRFEKCLIATLSGCEHCRHSANWLGIYAKNPRIEQSGLWNIRHTQSTSPLLDGDWFSKFEQLLKSSR